ncbi:hypothetical protein [Sphingobacterium haloxyli]|uniref:Uncharacterized protein n=1 Tax=Sphingobacterium haloxyli TaxID=2100533 RepID=A0A2S9J5K5_9SPHI|nr:hypothetical protein [Sphingobacterium haloxyli]PRD48024.1 hypothetical protein C5745_05795 [Sphingobacterium haloxyli]
MVFDNYTNISLFNYEIHLETIVEAVCEISLDIGIQLGRLIELRNPVAGFTILDLFSDEFLLEMSIRPEEVLDIYNNSGQLTRKGMGKEGLIGKIAAYFNEQITRLPEFEASLSATTDVVVLNRLSTKFMGNGDKGKDRLITAIKKTKILQALVEKLNIDKIRKSLGKIAFFENDIFYKGVVSEQKFEGHPEDVIVLSSILKIDELNASPIDEKDIWINEKFYKKYSFFSVSNDISILSNSAGLELGILVGNCFIPYVNVQLTPFIKPEFLKSYYYNLLTNTFSKKKRGVDAKVDDLVKDFRTKVNNPKLSLLLSHLKNNFYLDGTVVIDAEFSHFFNSVVSVEQLEHLKDYHFLLSPSVQAETALGVYTNVKKDTDYNLIHWLNHDGDSKVNHYRSVSAPKSSSKKFVSTLKPSICYYFLSKYFEDFVEIILKENGYTYVTNHHFTIDKEEHTEVDFLIETPTKITYVEAKTKISKFYIEGYLRRASQLIDKFKMLYDEGIEIQFLLIGSFSDKTVSDYQYFIDASGKKESGYNIAREGLNCIPYHFDVPIPDKEGRTITVIAEPEFEKLKQIILEVCPK